MKTCTFCKIIKPKEEFGIHKRDGLNHWCKLCTRTKSRSYYQKNSQKVKDYQKKYNLENSNKIKIYKKKYRKKNEVLLKEKKKLYCIEKRDMLNALRMKWAKENPERRREISRKYYHSHKLEHLSNVRARQVSLQKRTPLWVDLKAIKEFYKNRPKGMEVDHIFPLKAKNVSGLHVIENLQYLSKSENRIKNNKVLHGT